MFKTFRLEYVYATKQLYRLAAPHCKCDFRGKHTRKSSWGLGNLFGKPLSDGGDWCWLQESPCKSLTGRVYDNSETWGDCEVDGVKNLECNTVSGITR